MPGIFEKIVEQEEKLIQRYVDDLDLEQKDSQKWLHLNEYIQHMREALNALLANKEKFAYFMEGLDARNIVWDLYDGKITVKSCVFGHNNTYDYGEHPPEKYECTVDDDFLRELFEYENFVPEVCGDCCGCGDW